MCASVCVSSARACAGKMTDAASIACMPLTMPTEARGLDVPEYHMLVIMLWYSRNGMRHLLCVALPGTQPQCMTQWNEDMTLLCTESDDRVAA